MGLQHTDASLQNKDLEILLKGLLAYRHGKDQ